MSVFPSKISLAQIPTPIHYLSRLSEEFDIDLRVKRDDLTGAALGGNKVRKLEYLLADAQSKGCDAIITCGAVTSNHARAAAVAARQVGMEAHLILAGEAPEFAHGNLQLDLLVGAGVEYISRADYSNNIDEILQEAAHRLRSQGKKPYVIPTGGSNSVGLLGYVEAVREMQTQCLEMKWKPDFVVCAVGSGGTYSGLFLGNSLFPITSHILGVLVCGTVSQFCDKIKKDISEACDQNNLAVPDLSAIELVDGYIGEGYAKTNASQLQLIRKVAGAEGMILDPVYTGKTFAGLYGECLKGRIPKQANVLFIHTGGIFGLSSFSDEMKKVWPSMDYWSNN
ncbi:MAG: D-cysteine desulfhydrase family protein [Candidatus Omnitrophica bacterium]|nr:D-cysteine desulfhydrase family protein [Candidatus Omnitrophota bacterium]